MSAIDSIAGSRSQEIALKEYERLEFDVSGMTCGSCAARVQRTLSREPGVTDALVNYATGRASVELVPGALDGERLIAAVRKAGYGAELVGPSPSEHGQTLERREADEQRSLLRRILLAVPLAIVIGMLTYAAPHDPTARGWPPCWRCRCSSGAGCRSCARHGSARVRAPPTWTR